MESEVGRAKEAAIKISKMLVISALNVYPIKSLGGLSVDAATVTDRGLQYDRQWMLVDNNNRFLTQRENAEMALLQVKITEGGLVVYKKRSETENVFIPFEPTNDNLENVIIWDDECQAVIGSNEINNWFSEALSIKCKLAYMPGETKRLVDTGYAKHNDITTFTDGYPFLMIGQSSLDELNSRLPEALPMNRFRPNIVFTGGDAYAEDTFQEFVINGITFFGVKLSSRCVITTINQENTIKGKEPLKTLATYRSKNNKTYYGQNLVHEGSGVIKVGDAIEIIETKPGVFI